MSEFRKEGTSCPIPPHPIVSMELCQPCVYFRGASTFSEETEESKKRSFLEKLIKKPEFEPIKWTIVCNWPRNGSETWKPLDKPLDDYSAEEIKSMTKGAQ